MNHIIRSTASLVLMGISAFSAAQADIEISIDRSNETELNGSELNLVMNTTQFIRDGDINPQAITLLNAPAGLSVTSVTSSAGGTDGSVLLAFTPGDFDADSTNFHISVHDSVLTTTVTALSDSITLFANVETATFNSGLSQNLDEYSLDNGQVTLNLGGSETFTGTGDLGSSNFELVNFPAGTNIGSVNATSITRVRIYIDFTYADFDADSSNCQIMINPNVLNRNKPNHLYSSTFTVSAVVENPGSTLTPVTGVLKEYELNNRVLNLWLEDEWIDDPGSFNAGNLSFIDQPPGVGIATAAATDSANVLITLAGTYEDFDVDTVLKLGINSGILIQSPGGLALDTAIIFSYVEQPKAFLTPEQPVFNEYQLDGRFMDVFLSDEWIGDIGSFTESDVGLVAATPGLEIASISVADSANFRVYLEETIPDIDFDDDSLLRVSISQNKLVQVNGIADLVSDSVILEAYVENPEVDETPSGWLREWWLDSLSIDLKFTEEKFKSGMTIAKDHFHINNGPQGLGIESIRDIADSSVTLDLSFAYKDFDTSFNGVEIAITNTVLLQTTTDSLRASGISITPNIEPVVNSVDIPDEKIKVGDTVDVYLYLDVPGIHPDSVFELASGNVGGYPLFSLERKAGNEYWSKFTVTEDQNDYYAIEDIPVNNLRLDDNPITGETYNGAITGNNNDMIDSRIPVIGTLSVIGTGDKKIGDDVILLISAFEEGLFVEDTSSINGIPLSAPNVRFDPIGGGSYTFTYTIQGNDANVAPGALEAKVHLRDTAGNVSSDYPGILANDLSIDATAPLITSVTNTTSGDTAIIGSTVVLTVVADGSDYELGDQSQVNGVPGNKLALTNLGGGTYELAYTVQEGDPVVMAGNLTASIEMQDVAGNKSAPVTEILDNDINVFSERPTARLTGSDEICLNDTATLFITLTGTPPWTVRYKDASGSYYIYDIISADYTLKTIPAQTMNYQIEQVIDGTGNTNTGLGTSLVTVNPLPTVDILNLDPVYAIDVATFTLQGSPAGGTFTGPGVITAEQTFTPAAAGLSGYTSHQIIYEYTDSKQCYWADTAYVDVVEAEVTWFYPDVEEFACYLDASYTLRTVNTSGSTGQFSVPEVSDPDFLVDNGDNSVTLYPARLDWPVGSSNRQYKVVYKYDRQGVEVTENITLDIEYFDTTRITGLTETVFCSSEDPVEVFGNKDEGVYTGPGISRLTGFNYQFDPGEANIGLNRLYYTYTSPHNCVQSDSADILVNPTPVSDFVILDTCIFKRPVGDTIRFLNTTDTAGLGTLAWEWNFGDIASGLDNISNLENPVHWYSDPGNWTIKLTSTTVNGCANTYTKPFSFGDKPMARLSWNTECFTDAPILFSSAGTEHTDLISTYQWIITDLSGNEVVNAILDGTQETLPCTFPERDNYRVELKVVSELQCRDNDVDTIYLRPYFQNLTTDSDYFEDFEGTAPGWIPGSAENSILQSWEFNTVEATRFPYESVNGSKAWFTDLERKDTIEQSWVSSPCFDFSGTRRPMIKMDIKVSSDRDRDGTALQYTTDDGKTWNNLGTINDGSINWYNTFRILNGPGGQGEGWTGDFVFDENPQWKKAKHELDDLRGESRVQFRIAYGSNGSSLEGNKGFAFDNIWIGERSRVVLLEHFTNSGDEASKKANSKINNLVSNNPLDVIDIQYHAEVSGLSDKMNEDNPAPASARALFYGTRNVPYSLLDGGGSSEEWIYDYTEEPLDTLDLYTRVLQDPGFKITIQDAISGGTLEADITLEALDTLPEKEYILYTAIVEKEITDPSYAGANGETVFQNVVRDMLPSAAGTSFIQGWDPGDKQEISFDWTIEYVLDQEMISVVAFVQDAGSKVVYQAAGTDPELTWTSIGEMLQANDVGMLVYPNPARGRAYVLFREEMSGAVRLQLFNPLGSMIMNRLVQPGQEICELDIGDLSAGIYYVRASCAGEIIGIQKLVITD